MTARPLLLLALAAVSVPSVAGPKEWKAIGKAFGKSDCAKVMQLAPDAFEGQSDEPKRLDAIEAVVECVTRDVMTDAPPPLPGQLRIAGHVLASAPDAAVEKRRAALVNATAVRMATLQQEGDLNAAIAMADALLSVSPEDPGVHMLRLGAHGQNGDWSVAAKDLEWVIEAWDRIPGKQRRARNQLLSIGAQALAIVWDDLEDPAALMARAETAAEASGDPGLLHQVRAFWFGALAARALPRRDLLDRLLAARPDDPNLQQVDVLLLAEEDPAAAVPRMNAYLAERPDDLEVHFTLGVVHINFANAALQEQSRLGFEGPRAKELDARMMAEHELAWPHFETVAQAEGSPLRLMAVQQLKSMALTMGKNDAYKRYKALEAELQ